MHLTKKQWALVIFIPLFYLAWAVVEIGLMPIFERELGADSTAVTLLKEGLLKVLLWIVPEVLLLRQFDREVHIPLRELFSVRFNWLHFGILLAIVCGYLILQQLFNTHSLHFTVSWKLLLFLLVGITEEMTFRGWLLNAMYTEQTKKYMLEVNAVMFLLIHIPCWIHEDMLTQAFAGLGFLSVLAMGLIFAWSFVHFRSILPPVLLHIAYDTLLTMMD